MRGHKMGNDIPDGNTQRGKRGRGKIAAVVVSAAVILAILSAAAVMRDNVGISAESGYTADRDAVMQDTAASIEGKAAELQERLQEMRSVMENSMESIAGTESFLAGFDERLSGMDSILSDIAVQADRVENLITDFGWNMSGETIDGDQKGSNGNAAVGGNNVPDDSAANNAGSDVIKKLSVVNSGLKTVVSASQKEIRALVSEVNGGNTESFTDVFERTETLQETMDGLVELLDANLLELNVLIASMWETSSAEHWEVLDEVMELQEGLASDMQLLSASVSGLVDRYTAELMAELDSVSDCIADTETSVSTLLSAMQSDDISRMEDVRNLFSEVKGSLEETESRFNAAHASVKQMVREFHENRDAQHTELASVLEKTDRNFAALMENGYNGLTDTINSFESSMDEILAMMQENVDNSFASMNANVDSRFLDMNTSMDSKFLSTGAAMDAWFVNTDKSITDKFSSLDAGMVKQFADETKNMNDRFADTGSIMDGQFAKTNSDLKISHDALYNLMNSLSASLQGNMTAKFDSINNDMVAGFFSADSSVDEAFSKTDTAVNDRFSAVNDRIDSNVDTLDTLVNGYKDDAGSGMDDLMNYIGSQFDSVYTDVSNGKQLVADAVDNHAADTGNNKYALQNTDVFSDIAAAVAGIGTGANVTSSDQMTAGTVAYNGNTGQYVTGSLVQSSVSTQVLKPGGSISIAGHSYFLDGITISAESIQPIIDAVNDKGGNLSSGASITDIVNVIDSKIPRYIKIPVQLNIRFQPDSSFQSAVTSSVTATVVIQDGVITITGTDTVSAGRGGYGYANADITIGDIVLE